MSTPDPVMDTPAKLSFSDLGALNPIPEEAQASFTGREKKCSDPGVGPMTTGDLVMDTPTKPPFGDSGALDSIPEEAKASSTGREEDALIPAMSPCQQEIQ